MKTLTLFISILTAHIATAAEVWWLEMDKTFHDALIKRFSEGDPAACRQIGDRLPALIKEGKIKELEWVASDSKTGGRHFPAGKVEVEYPDGRKFQMKKGSVLQTTTKSDLFRFQIATPGDDTGATLVVQTHAPFAKQWQPIFSIETAGRVRILLGRDPAATEDFWKPRGLLNASAPIPEATKLTLMLCENHPLLAAAVEPQKGKHLIFYDNRGLFLKPSGDLRQFGTTFECAADPKHGCMVHFETLLEKQRSPTLGEMFWAVGSGKLQSTGDSIKFPVNTYVQKIKGDGTTENANKKISGEAVATITLFPGTRN